MSVRKRFEVAIHLAALLLLGGQVALPSQIFLSAVPGCGCPILAPFARVGMMPPIPWVVGFRSNPLLRLAPVHFPQPSAQNISCL